MARIRPRSEEPFRALDEAVCSMIRAHANRPCPTRKDIREWTGMPKRKIWGYLAGMQERGLIEIEVRNNDPESTGKRLRRMRVKGEDWTLWTSHPKLPEECTSQGHPFFGNGKVT